MSKAITPIIFDFEFLSVAVEGEIFKAFAMSFIVVFCMNLPPENISMNGFLIIAIFQVFQRVGVKNTAVIKKAIIDITVLIDKVLYT